jgi:hypothetical protein
MVNRPQFELITPSASIEEAAAIMAALERFERDTAPQPTSVRGQPDQWAHAAILEGVSHQQDDVPDPWINT